MSLQFNNKKKTADVDSSTHAKSGQHKPVVKSKDEEDILNDENIFHSRRERVRGRMRTKILTSRANSPNLRQQNLSQFASLMKKGDQNSIPIMQFGVCKVCGNIINNQANQSLPYNQQISSKYIDFLFPTIHIYVLNCILLRFTNNSFN